ncbi:hypothetical protein [Segniliparus rugosus]|uniref:hypothetical protein n=1 Tax=Segniliparus rugosus TaxID=286804 RepID=UPI0012EB6BD1|nr:hypothetical protein [Segniliparus rugosus]
MPRFASNKSFLFQHNQFLSALEDEFQGRLAGSLNARAMAQRSAPESRAKGSIRRANYADYIEIERTASRRQRIERKASIAGACHSADRASGGHAVSFGL